MQASVLTRSSGTSLIAPTVPNTISFGVALNRIRKVPVVNGVVASLQTNFGHQISYGMTTDDRRVWMILSPSVAGQSNVLGYFDTLTGQLSQGFSPNTTWNPQFLVAHPNGHIYISDLSNPVLWDFNPSTNTWNSIPLPSRWAG
jgi:streptogramin lyase